MLILKGFILGICKIIPGVSGGMVAITLGLYDKGIEAISNFFKNPKKNILFLGQLGLGILIAILLFSKIINYALNNFYTPTILLFIGLIIGGIPSLLKKVNSKKKTNWLITLVVMSIIILLGTIKSSSKVIELNSFNMLIGGVIESGATIIPGLSSTAMLLLMGMYKPLIELLSNMNSISYFVDNLNLILPFALSILVTAFLFIKLMNYLLTKHEEKTYYAIFGLVLGSVIILLLQIFSAQAAINEIIIGIILLILGYYIGKKLEKI